MQQAEPPEYAAVEPARTETPAEQADRNWVDLLQEFRVLQTGVQVLGGFLLTLPFAPRFQSLDQIQRVGYLMLVVLAAINIALLLLPIALHRRMFGWQRKPQLVAAGHVIARVAIAGVALLVAGIAAFVFDVVLGHLAGLIVIVVMLIFMSLLLVAVPRMAGGKRPRRRDGLWTPPQ
ncbi:sodium:proton antiporter [Epidermidibacterium keratini]|uniref:Sodium:proton antiporter n=1 Tax=Epidermidibacterium keratini TaxID=1891644 RepID=A0A7L4YJ43_9ACTN|nr:DUF6328 family protein [Epidermidibacterium keratini]QHB99275.1 sodium:proton antiporter [Epidermidibacterium keratini]